MGLPVCDATLPVSAVVRCSAVKSPLPSCRTGAPFPFRNCKLLSAGVRLPSGPSVLGKAGTNRFSAACLRLLLVVSFLYWHPCEVYKTVSTLPRHVLIMRDSGLPPRVAASAPLSVNIAVTRHLSRCLDFANCVCKLSWPCCLSQNWGRVVQPGQPYIRVHGT